MGRELSPEQGRLLLTTHSHPCIQEHVCYCPNFAEYQTPLYRDAVAVLVLESRDFQNNLWYLYIFIGITEQGSIFVCNTAEKTLIST